MIKEVVSSEIARSLKERCYDLNDFLISNNMKLPDISLLDDEGSVIFESCNYLIEIFESGLISHFSDNNGYGQFLNFTELDNIKRILIKNK
jgi:hypothetical protein